MPADCLHIASVTNGGLHTGVILYVGKHASCQTSARVQAEFLG
jgi:hypothetical protein